MFTPIGFYKTKDQSLPTTDGLILYFDAGVSDSYPGTGTTWTDISPLAQTTLTINGAPPHTSGDAGFFSFNGTDEYAQDDNDDVYFTTETAGNDIAFEGVFRTDTTSGYRALATYWGGAGLSNQIWWWGLSGATAGGIHFALRESLAAGGNNQFYNSADIVDTSTWYHMVWNLTYNPSGDGTLNCWINNVQVVTDAALTVNDMRAATAANKMNIARQESNGSYFDGDIAAIRLYDNKNLTTDEIQQNYEYFKRRGYFPVITTNLEQWLDVVGAGGTESSALTDSSGNGRNATNSGLTWDATNSWWYVSSNTDWTKHIASGYRLSNFGGSYSYTLECWVNMQGVSGTNYIGIIHNRSGIYSNNFIEIAMGGADEGDVNFGLSDTSGNEGVANTPSTYPNQWVMLTFVNDGSTNTMTIFVNGVSVATGDSSAVGNVTRGENLSLYGNFLRSNRWIEDAYFGSYRVYSAAHTAAQALQNYEAEKAHFGL